MQPDDVVEQNKNIDFIERITEILNNEDYYTNVISPLFKPGNSIAIMPMPSSDYDHYYDGSYRQRYAFQVMARHNMQLTALYTLQNIVELLRNIKSIPSNNNSYEFEGIELTTDPNLIAKDAKLYEFAAQFKASLYVKN